MWFCRKNQFKLIKYQHAGEDITMKFAGFWTRLLAFNTDLILLLALFYGLGALISTNLHLYIACLITWLLYEIAFSASPWAATPGKHLIKIKIVDAEGNRLSTMRVVIRTFSKLLSFALLMGGFTLIALHAKSRGLHDLLAGSLVIHSDPL